MTYYVKAIYAGAVTFLGALIAAMQAGDLTTTAWLTIALATIISMGGVLGLQAAPASVATSIKS